MNNSMTPSRDEVIKAAENLIEWHKAYTWGTEADATSMKDKHGNFVFCNHHDAQQTIRQLIALVPEEGSVVYKANLKSDKKKLK